MVLTWQLKSSHSRVSTTISAPDAVGSDWVWASADGARVASALASALASSIPRLASFFRARSSPHRPSTNPSCLEMSAREDSSACASVSSSLRMVSSWALRTTSD